MDPSRRYSTSKRRYQETRSRPMGEWKQKFRAMVSEKAKKHRMERVTKLRGASEIASGEDVDMGDPSYSFDLSNPDNFKLWLEQWWREFAEEEGINDLSLEDYEALLVMEDGIYQNELREEQIFKQYEQAQEWERLALEAQIESYQNENS